MSRPVLLALAVSASLAGFFAARPGAVVPGPPPAPVFRPDAAISVPRSPAETPAVARATRAVSSNEGERAASLLRRLPARFEKIEGRTAKDVSFIARGYGRQLVLSCDRAVLAPGAGAAADVTMHIEGASACRAAGERELPGRTNYLIGDDASQWRTGIRSYERASFPQVYPGIDLVYYGTGDHLEYDFVVSPGTDPSAIALRFAGTDRVEIDADGALVLHAPGGELRQHAPAVYQEIDGEQRRVEGRYVMRGDSRVGFALGAYERSEALTIDPVLVYSSYLGTFGDDTAVDVALDSSGNIYLLGETSSTSFPTMNPYQRTHGGGHYDVFIAELDPSGTRLVYATYLGGSDTDLASSLAVDAAGNIFLAGYTISNDFPTVAGSYAYGPGSANSGRTFVVKLTNGGTSLGYVATIETGASVAGLAVDTTGQAHVIGTTVNAGLPVLNAAQPQCAGGVQPPGPYCAGDAYLFKLNAAGSALMYATYLGGSAIDNADDVAVDAAGFAYVVGSTRSADFPVRSAFQSTLRGYSDAFLTVVSPDGSTFVSSSFLGGSGPDVATAVAVHGDGSVVIAGGTNSTDFPELNPAQPADTGGAFVTKLDATLTRLVFSTHLGNAPNGEAATGVAFDSAGAVYVAGSTTACGFPLLRAYPVLPAPGCFGFRLQHPFVASYSPAGALRHEMRVGGESNDLGGAMILGPDNTIYLAGYTRSMAFPVINAFQRINHGTTDSGSEVILMKFAMALSVSGTSPATARSGGGDAVEISGLNFMSGATVQFDGGTAVAATFVNPTLIRAIAPAHDAGPVTVTVNNPDGESTTRPDGLQYGACAFSMSVNAAAFSFKGGTGSLDLDNDDGSCSWTARSSGQWLHLTSAKDGIGDAHVQFAADEQRDLTDRTATLTIAGMTFTVTERATRGDFDGDGRADLMTFGPADGRWTLYGQPGVTFGAAGDIAVPGDYDGNGLTDRAVYRPSTGEWIIQGIATMRYGAAGDVPVPGDYDGDRVTDIAVFRPSTGRWYIHNQAATDWGLPGDLPVPADYTGNGRTGIAVFRPSTAEWWILGGPGPVMWGAPGGVIPVPADYDGDGRADMAVFSLSSGVFSVRDQFARSFGVPGDIPMPLDYDGDGRANLAVYRPGAALWFIDGFGAGISTGARGDIPAFYRFDAYLRAAADLDRDRRADVVLSQGSTWKLLSPGTVPSITSLAFGLDTDIRRVADFDGDGRADLVLFRAGTGVWYIALSTTGYASYAVAQPWGTTGDAAMPADYDGDGRADRAVFRPSLGRWYIKRSNDDTTVTLDWGFDGDIPMAADADGDGRADPIVFRPSTGRWYIRRSSDDAMAMADWGLAGDIPAPADYDGDGRIDLAVFRPSTGIWWILSSATGFTAYSTIAYGQDGDVPAPADYNGDGLADVAVFRPSTGEFFEDPSGLLFTTSPGDAIVR